MVEYRVEFQQAPAFSSSHKSKVLGFYGHDQLGFENLLAGVEWYVQPGDTGVGRR